MLRRQPSIEGHTVSANRNKIIFSGNLGVNREVWSTSCSWQDIGSDQGDSNDSNLQDWANDILSGLTAMTSTALENHLSASGTVEKVTVQWYNGANELLDSVESTGTAFTGATTANMPFQTACVISLATGISGARRRGRMYWPSLGGDVDSSGNWTGTTSATLTATSAKELFTMIASTYPGALSMSPVVYSNVLQDVTAVTALKVGSIPDTQRRRRDNLPEIYSSVVYP